jgi:hypothetical protein
MLDRQPLVKDVAAAVLEVILLTSLVLAVRVQPGWLL